jgi:SAM-dependent methyltransferase
LLGCGNSRAKLVSCPEIGDTWDDLTTLDVDPSCKPDVVWDLNELPLPFEANSFDEIAAYEVLEHCGTQGDWRFFFGQFSDFWRILKPGGYLVSTCPMWDSPWAWSDPGHTRVLSKHSLAFLVQKEYEAQVGKTHMTDYRHVYRADFKPIAITEQEHTWGFILQAVKP